MIKIIEAPTEIYELNRDTDIIVFLAGGITNVKEWQKDVCSNLLNEYKNTDISKNIYILNPRRSNFPIDDKKAAFEQILWEFVALNKCNIFSMFFSSGNSDQPICMFEYGKYLNKYMNKLFDTEQFIVTSEPEYRRYNDVRIQTSLEDATIKINTTLDQHIEKIKLAIKYTLDKLNNEK